MPQRSSPNRRRLLAATAAFAVLALAACGGDDDGAAPATTEAAGDPTATTAASSAGVAEAEQIVADLNAPLEFVAPGAAIDVGTQLEGKDLYFVSAALEYEFTQNILGGMEEAAAAAGVEVKAFDAKGDTTTATRQIEQAIAQNAGGIAIMNFPSAVLEAPIKEARDAGIPVFMVLDGDAGAPSAAETDLGIVAKVSYCYTCAGQQMAAMAVAQSGGAVNAAVIGVPDSGAAVLEVEGFTSELARLCADCTAKVYDAPTAQWATQLPSIATSAVQDSNVNFIIPVFAALQDIMKPSLLAAGAEGRVSVITYNANSTAMADLQNKEFTTGLIGAPEDWLGWGIMDQYFRVLTGNDAAADEHIGHRAFTEVNLADADPEAGANYGDVDFRAEYLTLWGLDG